MVRSGGLIALQLGSMPALAVSFGTLCAGSFPTAAASASSTPNSPVKGVTARALKG